MTRRPDDDLERSIPSDVRQEAAAIVKNYSVLLAPDDEYGYKGIAIELPSSPGVGKTADDCYRNTQETTAMAVAVMIKGGKKPPQPGSRLNRTIQVNVKFNQLEERLLSSAAAAMGFKGIGDFVRYSVLQSMPTLLSQRQKR